MNENQKWLIWKAKPSNFILLYQNKDVFFIFFFNYYLIVTESSGFVGTKVLLYAEIKHKLSSELAGCIHTCGHWLTAAISEAPISHLNLTNGHQLTVKRLPVSQRETKELSLCSKQPPPEWSVDGITGEATPLLCLEATLRNIYKAHASQYDPLGFIPPFLKRAHLGDLKAGQRMTWSSDWTPVSGKSGQPPPPQVISNRNTSMCSHPSASSASRLP